ncbi:zinc ribbon domain-containing protein, partial [candidate division KSB1 bacterium]|nr:zinc ribbon domain-containing protein [candidate division KSB1 bacterium]
MNRKKVIVKFAKILGTIFLIAIVVLILQIPYHNWQYKKLVQIREKHVQELTHRYEQILQQFVNDIKHGLDLYFMNIKEKGKVISDEDALIWLKRITSNWIDSKILKSDEKLFLWMSDTEGNFLFGRPTGVFLKLNEAYDQHIEIIKKDGHYLNRNDFIRHLVHLHKNIDFGNLDTGDWGGYSAWRFRDNQRYYESGSLYDGSKFIKLSANVENVAGEVLGAIFLNVDDNRNQGMYLSKWSFSRYSIFSDFLNPIFGTIAVICGLLLWFLMPTWVYVDAKQRDVKNPMGMALLATVAPVIGLLIYLITRPEYYKSNICPECEKDVNGDLPFCPYCGYNLAANYCPQCQYA